MPPWCENYLTICQDQTFRSHSRLLSLSLIWTRRLRSYPWQRHPASDHLEHFCLCTQLKPEKVSSVQITVHYKPLTGLPPISSSPVFRSDCFHDGEESAECHLYYICITLGPHRCSSSLSYSNLSYPLTTHWPGLRLPLVTLGSACSPLLILF